MTKRLMLRPWQESDLEPFVAINADPRAMEYFPGVRGREETASEYHRIIKHFAKYGWGLWAVTLIDNPTFMGFIGLNQIDSVFPFAPAVEIGWRLAPDYWGKGYATEGAMAVLKYGFATVKLSEIVAFTTEHNMRSRNVMEKIGMHHNPKDDFDHPKLPEGHPLRRHVLYRLGVNEWKKSIS